MTTTGLYTYEDSDGVLYPQPIKLDWPATEIDIGGKLYRLVWDAIVDDQGNDVTLNKTCKVCNGQGWYVDFMSRKPCGECRS